MIVLLALLLGGACSAGAWRALRPVYASALLTRLNFRGRELPTAGGLAMVVGVVAAEALLAAAAALDLADDLAVAAGGRALAVVAVAGFALLGLIDDLLGDASARGFTGHLQALRGGELTTGGLKLLGGGLLAVALAGWARDDGLAWLAVDAALIATTANLGNLFDRAPGRTVKVMAGAGVVVAAIAAFDPRLAGPCLVVGAGIGLVWPDLRERMMLGDTGANPLGAAVGLGIVLVGAGWVRLAVLVVVVGLNAASERVSFSAIVDGTPVLRAIDLAGREPPDRDRPAPGADEGPPP